MNAKNNSAENPRPTGSGATGAQPRAGAATPGGTAGRTSAGRTVQPVNQAGQSGQGEGEKNSIFTAIRRVPGTVWIALIVAILVAAFVLQNQAKMEFELLWLDLTAPTWAVLAVLFAIGVLVGFLIRHRGNAKKNSK